MTDDFNQFWQAYPRKVGKLAAWKAWQKQQPALSDVLAALAWQVHQWDDPQYIPHPTTYLNQGRWMDEPAVQPVKQPRPVQGIASWLKGA